MSRQKELQRRLAALLLEKRTKEDRMWKAMCELPPGHPDRLSAIWEGCQQSNKRWWMDEDWK